MGRKRIHKIIEVRCFCGKIIKTNEDRLKRGHGKFCSKECFWKDLKNRPIENHSNWRGGMFVTDDGYRNVKMKNHPHCNFNGYVLEHRLVMEKKLGRYLSDDEIVHHVNEDRLDNRIENLQLVSRSEHNTIHFKGKPLKNDHRKKISIALRNFRRFI